jgi:23S rRNA pseudouridine2605 synthase
MISAGRVTVDGVVAALGDSADPEIQRVEIDGVMLPEAREYVYIAMYKPRGVVTTRKDEQGRRTVLDILPPEVRHTVPAGRLDLSSEGLLILSNDGDAIYALTHPSAEVEKTYIAWCRAEDGGTIEGALAALRRPMVIEGQTLCPAKAREISPGVLLITVHEGKNRQIRNMCRQAGLHVTRLKRSAEGGISLGELRPGQWRYLTDTETQYILSLKERAGPERRT